MPTITDQLADIANRIEQDEDFAMKVGEDARSVLESEGLPDAVIAAVLAEAEAEVVGFAVAPDAAELIVRRVADACRTVASRQA